MFSTQPPSWRLPPGVSRGLWDYVHSRNIAEGYDEYFEYNRLFDFDAQVIARRFDGAVPGNVVADFGCGTGRALIPLARRGLRGVAVDLSPAMLALVQQKADDEQLPVMCLRCNLVELDGLAEDSADHAVCLFSTLGMIRGRANRCTALAHFRRIVKPEGLLVLHVHNYWYNLFDPGGPWWVIGNLLRASLRRDIEPGDKFFDYRGVPNMFLHVFRQGELTADLHEAGFSIEELIPLSPQRFQPLRFRWLASRLRANGWIVVCR